MEASALGHTARLPALAGRSPLLRLQTDEKLIALIRRGHHGAFEALVQRYQPRLLAFCRHMLSSRRRRGRPPGGLRTSFNAICAGKRRANARPWLYRIACNRCLNHLRGLGGRPDSMDVFERDGGASTADTVHKRAEFLHLVSDVQELPGRSAPPCCCARSTPSPMTRSPRRWTRPCRASSRSSCARVSLAEAAEARLLTCDEVRLELGQVAEAWARRPRPRGGTCAPASAAASSRASCARPPARSRRSTRSGRSSSSKLYSLAKLGIGGAASGAAATGGAGSGAAGIAGTAATAAGGLTAGGAVSAGVGTIASKAAAGVAAVAIVTAGAVEGVTPRSRSRPPRRLPSPPPLPRSRRRVARRQAGARGEAPSRRSRPRAGTPAEPAR